MGVGEMGVGEMGVGEMGVGEMGVGETGVDEQVPIRPNMTYFNSVSLYIIQGQQSESLEPCSHVGPCCT